MIQGVIQNAIASGVKSHNRYDLGYIYIPDACASACVVTQNASRASCVILAERYREDGVYKVILYNSGNANMLTGKTGVHHTDHMQALVAQALDLPINQVIIASTGKISLPLPIDKISDAIPKLFSETAPQASEAACIQAMMTTDLTQKSVRKTAVINNQTVEIAGIAKGSGMIEPNMATMLAFLVTNIDCESSQLQPLFADCVTDTFNMISVDSDTSTNDMAVLLSRPVCRLDWSDPVQYAQIKQLVYEACRDLAIQIVSDGEGATRLIEVKITSAPSQTVARQIAKSILNSPLVKTAIHGCDPNWGRIMAAAGKANATVFSIEAVTLTVGGYRLFAYGEPCVFSIDALRQYLKNNTCIPIVLDLGAGDQQAMGWGCDLSKDYIDINVDYT